MEINIKDFSANLKMSTNKDATSMVYTYDAMLEMVRKDLASLRKAEMDRNLEMNKSIGNKDKVVIKNKEYLAEQKATVEKEIRLIIQKNQYKVRGYEGNTDK